MQDGLSVADAMALSNRDNDGFGNGGFMCMIALFFLFSMFGWGGYGGFGNGWGRNGEGAALNGSLTRDQLCSDMNFQSLANSVRGIQNGLCDGFYAQNTTMLNVSNGLQRDIGTGFASTNAAINEARFENQQCCCNTQKEIIQNRYESAQNTSAIIQAQERGTQRILDWMCDRENRNLRDENMRNYISSQLCGVVRYPQSTTYSAGYSPCFNGGGYGSCNNYGCNNI